MELRNQLFQYWRSSILAKIIVINVTMFIVVTFAPKLVDWLSLHPSFKTFINRPWSILTYSLFHHHFLNLLFNMLWLYWMGTTLENYLGKRKVLPIYVFGILMAGIVFLFISNLTPILKNNFMLWGSSTGVLALIWATVALLPKRKMNFIFIGEVLLLYVAIAYTIFELATLQNNSQRFAHLGGALAGYLFIKLQQRGTDLSKPFNTIFDKIATATTSKPKQQKTVSRLKVKRGRAHRANVRSDKEVNNERKLNKILEKINKVGYEKLSKEEQEFLFKQSNKN